MLELTANNAPPQVPGRAPPPVHLPITDISQWVEKFSMMIAIICSRFPDKATEMFAYLGTIVGAERDYEGQCWVTYDRQFRRKALANKYLNWLVIDSRLYNEAFMGCAKAIARCSFYLQDDHIYGRILSQQPQPLLPRWIPWPGHMASSAHLAPPQSLCHPQPGTCGKISRNLPAF